MYKTIQIFNSNVHFVFNIWLLLSEISDTVIVISWTKEGGHENMQTQGKLLYWSHD